MKRIGLLGAVALFLAGCGEAAPLQNGDYLVYQSITAGSTSGEGAHGLAAQSAYTLRLDFQENGGGWTVTINDRGDTSTVDLDKSLKGPDGPLAPANMGRVWIPTSLRSGGRIVDGGKVVGTSKKWQGHECIVVKYEDNWIRLYDKESGVLIWLAAGQISGMDPRPITGSTVRLTEQRLNGITG